MYNDTEQDNIVEITNEYEENQLIINITNININYLDEDKVIKPEYLLYDMENDPETIGLEQVANPQHYEESEELQYDILIKTLSIVENDKTLKVYLT